MDNITGAELIRACSAIGAGLAVIGSNPLHRLHC